MAKVLYNVVNCEGATAFPNLEKVREASQEVARDLPKEMDPITVPVVGAPEKAYGAYKSTLCTAEATADL